MEISRKRQDELNRLEESLRSALRPVTPRPDFHLTVRDHLNHVPARLERRFEIVRAARYAVLAVLSVLGGVLVFITGWKIVYAFLHNDDERISI